MTLASLPDCADEKVIDDVTTNSFWLLNCRTFEGSQKDLAGHELLQGCMSDHSELTHSK